MNYYLLGVAIVVLLYVAWIYRGMAEIRRAHIRRDAINRIMDWE